MSDVQWERIRPLVATSREREKTIDVVFLCPVTGVRVGSSAPYVGVDDPVHETVLVRVLRLFGIAVSPKNARDVPVLDRRRLAITEAFESVRSNFVWDLNSRRYTIRSTFEPLPFEKLVHETSITRHLDRATLTRMLTEVATADGQILDEERRLFRKYGDQDLSIETVAERVALTAVDLANVSPETREAMFALCVAVAAADEDYSAPERALLEFFRQGLGIGVERAIELDQYAREYIMNELLEMSDEVGMIGQTGQRDILLRAKRLGLEVDAVERLEVRLHVRREIEALE